MVKKSAVNGTPKTTSTGDAHNVEHSLFPEKELEKHLGPTDNADRIFKAIKLAHSRLRHVNDTDEIGARIGIGAVVKLSRHIVGTGEGGPSDSTSAGCTLPQHVMGEVDKRARNMLLSMAKDEAAVFVFMLPLPLG